MTYLNFIIVTPHHYEEPPHIVIGPLSPAVEWCMKTFVSDNIPINHYLPYGRDLNLEWMYDTDYFYFKHIDDATLFKLSCI
jgi:hypothetical protein